MRCVAVRTFLTFILVLALGQILIASESGASDWPRWRGKNMDGKALQTGVFNFDQGYGLKVNWLKPLGSSYSSVSIADGRVVTMFSDSTFDYVVALDPSNGAELWRYQIDSTYVGHDTSHDGQISTPTIDGDYVFVYGRKGQLFALSAENGKLIWSRNVKEEISPLEPFHGFGSSPIVVGDVLMCQTGGTKEHTVCGFNKSDGKLLWSAGADTINYQSPVSATFFGDEQLIAVADHNVYGINPESGEIFWAHRHNSGSQSINPLVIGEDKIFLKLRRQSTMLQLSKTDGKYSVAELWKTNNIRQTFNSTVHLNGYLYGYSGRFITCVDVATGNTVWKSRPPGDGFLILVDDHLVILTKRGTLHVAKASPEDYVEMASTQVFSGLTWTPPSFAAGSIYARNLFEIARVDIAPVDQLITLDQPEVETINPNGGFAKFVKKVETASDNEKKMLIDKFVKSQKSFPVIEDERFAHFIYNGEAKDIAMAGDMLAPGQEVPLNRINGTNFFFASFELEPDARVTYQIRKDFDNVISDPLNPHVAPAGPVMQGAGSELRMPGFKPVDHFAEPKAGVARGNIETFEFESKILSNKRNVHVYLPAGYTESKDRYPVLFVNYGQGAKDQMQMPNSLDNLIASKQIRPIITVFVEAPQSFQEYSRAGRDQHAQMYAEELLPHIDQKYRTKANADSRVIMGGDEGGFAAFYAAFNYPDIFRNVAGQSTHLHKPDGGDALTKIVSESEQLPIKIYMDWGKYDLIYQNGLSWPQLNEDFVKLLKEKGYSVDARKVNDGFGWASWRNRTDKILEAFFPLKAQN